MNERQPTDPFAREALARAEAGHTDIGPRARALLVAVFLACVGGAPAAELLALSDATAGGGSAWTVLADLPAAVATRLARRAGADAGAFDRLVEANRAVLESLGGFEDRLEDQSALGGWLRRSLQPALVALGVGNQRVLIGRGGWLFYEPDVSSITGAPFLDPDRLARRADSADEWTAPPQPDPRPAIIDFHRQLAARGILLVVVPTPVKPSIHPERLAARGVDPPVANPSWSRLLAALESAGVAVFDPAPALAAAARRDAQYLATDTHWRPAAMQATAGALARFIESRVPFGSAAGPTYPLEPSDVVNTGDTAAMLDLPPDVRLYPRETVETLRVFTPGGAPWRPSRDAEVLLLGDSFSNIYSLGSLGWGEGAGFAEHLSASLRRPVDRIVQNDEGAFATRRLLAQAALASPSRFARTRVVVYQFATRELALGDWAPVDLPAP